MFLAAGKGQEAVLWTELREQVFDHVEAIFDYVTFWNCVGPDL